MAVGFIFDLETQFAIAQLYAGKSATIVLCTGASWGKNATVAQVLGTELPPDFGYARTAQTIGSGSFEITNQRAIADMPAGDFTASLSGSFTFDAAVLLMSDGTWSPSTTASRLITGGSAASNYLETGSAHGLTTDEPILITTDSPGTNPGGIDATLLRYARVVNSTRFEVAATPGGAALDITDLGSIGSQPTRLRYARGRIVGAYKPPAPRTVFPGETVPIPFTFATANNGFGTGV